MREGNIGRFILDQITEGQLDWVPTASPFDLMILEGPNGRKEFPMYSGKKEYIQGLKKKFPKEEAEGAGVPGLCKLPCALLRTGRSRTDGAELPHASECALHQLNYY